LEQQAASSPYIETDIEAGHHLFQAGQFDRSCPLLGSASQWLQDHGWVREGIQRLEPFLAEAVRASMDRQLVGPLLGTVGLVCAALGQVERAIALLEQALKIGWEIKDPQIIRVTSAELERLRDGQEDAPPA